jgi:hypothetical protein
MVTDPIGTLTVMINGGECNGHVVVHPSVLSLSVCGTIFNVFFVCCQSVWLWCVPMCVYDSVP